MIEQFFYLSKEVMTAFIAAAGAVCVSTIGLIAAVRTAQAGRSNQIALEKFKQEIAERQISLVAESAARKIRSELLIKQISAIVSFRDLLSRIIDPSAQYIKLTEFSRLSEVKRFEFEQAYAEAYARQDDELSRRSHDAKSIIREIDSNLQKAAHEGTFDNELRSLAVTARVALGNIQSYLKIELLRELND